MACVGPRRLLLRVPNTALGSWGSVTKKRVGEKTMEGGLCPRPWGQQLHLHLET